VKLNELKPAPGAKTSPKRVGRGVGSGFIPRIPKAAFRDQVRLGKPDYASSALTRSFTECLKRNAGVQSG
jgi:hypothetical protein